MDAETVQGAEEGAVVTEQSVIDRIQEACGHARPPDGAFTVKDYVTRAKERGVVIKETNALRTLRDAMIAGQLHGRKFYSDGRQRWFFWE